MPDLSPFVAAAAVAVMAAFLVWFALGTQRNIRIGNDTLRWLQDGLPVLGPRTTVRWLGSSAVELRIAEAIEPFRQATVLVVLEPRDVGFLWAWARLRGRRDFMIVRGDLRTAPRIDVDVWDRRAWTGRPPEADATDRRHLDWADGVEARATEGFDPEPVRRAWDRIAPSTPALWRLSVQPVVPHLELHLRLPAREIPARRILEPMRDLGRAAAERR
jgi:hypothetical protein